MRIILVVFRDRFESYTSLKPFFEQYPQYLELKEYVSKKTTLRIFKFKQNMKFVLIAIGWVFLTLYLLIERTFKIIASILIIMWDFKFKKSKHFFWNKIDLWLFLDLFEFYSLKNYYLFRYV